MAAESGHERALQILSDRNTGYVGKIPPRGAGGWRCAWKDNSSGVGTALRAFTLQCNYDAVFRFSKIDCHTATKLGNASRASIGVFL